MNLSCVTLIHNPELLTYIKNIQSLIKEKTGSSFNMDHWAPHITLGHEIEVSEELFASLCKEIQDAMKNIAPITLSTSSFSVMKKETIKPPKLPYVINISIAPTPQIRDLSETLCDILKKYNVSWSFSGENGIDFLRLTLASRDLTEEGSKWFTDYSKEYPCEIQNITIDSIALVEFSNTINGTKVFYEQPLHASV